MTKKKNTTVSSEATPVIDGLAEAEAAVSTKAEKAARLVELRKAAKGAVKAAAKLEAWKAKTAARNPQVLVDTVRNVPVGDVLANGLVSKGRVVDVTCETCETIRTVNVQDAFQVRFCEEHKSDARKAAGKARRAEAKVAALLEIDEDALDAEIAELEATTAAA